MSARKFNCDTLESLRLNFSEQTESAEESFHDYYHSVKTMEVKISLIKAEEIKYCDKFTKEDNTKIISKLDANRTRLHNKAIGEVGNLNNLSKLLRLDAFLDGSVSENPRDRNEIAESLFEFCRTQEMQKDAANRQVDSNGIIASFVDPDARLEAKLNAAVKEKTALMAQKTEKTPALIIPETTIQSEGPQAGE